MDEMILPTLTDTLSYRFLEKYRKYQNKPSNLCELDVLLNSLLMMKNKKKIKITIVNICCYLFLISSFLRIFVFYTI